MIHPSSDRQHQYIPLIKDNFSKYIMAVLLKRKTAQEVATNFVNKWILQFGVPQTVVTDQGKEFYEATEEVMKKLGIEGRKSLTYHHQTFGSLENCQKGLGQYLRMYAKSHRQDWDLWLSFFNFTFNTTTNCATGYTVYDIILYTLRVTLWEIGSKTHKSLRRTVTVSTTELCVIFGEATRCILRMRRLDVAPWSKVESSAGKCDEGREF